VAAGKYYLETYGCALAEYESNLMEDLMGRAGYARVDSPDEADVIIINTCAVRLDTEQRIADRLREISRSFKGRKLVVAGCLAKARPGLISRIAPDASLLAPQVAHRIVEAVAAPGRVVLLDGERDTSVTPMRLARGRIATIMIQEGCRNKCAYCITKVSRGWPKSYPPRAIVEMVERSVRQGAVEIRLTGTDTAAYGVDLPGRPSLADLVGMILDKVEGYYRIRIGMMTPEEAYRILDSLLDVYMDPRVYKFFHIPVQSGSNRVLRIMGRKYTVEDFKNIHRNVKSRFPDSLFATDIIVGHPGETEDDFHDTVSLVEEARFERVHLAQYSIRPHTRAASMPQLSDSIKKARSTTLTRLIERIGSEIYGSYVGRTVEATIVSGSYRENGVTGRLDNYFPVIIPGATIDVAPIRSRVRIVGSSFFDLRGVMLEE